MRHKALQSQKDKTSPAAAAPLNLLTYCQEDNREHKYAERDVYDVRRLLAFVFWVILSTSVTGLACLVYSRLHSQAVPHQGDCMPGIPDR